MRGATGTRVQYGSSKRGPNGEEEICEEGAAAAKTGAATSTFAVERLRFPGHAVPGISKGQSRRLLRALAAAVTGVL